VYFQTGRPLQGLYCCYRGINLCEFVCFAQVSARPRAFAEMARAYVTLCFVNKVCGSVLQCAAVCGRVWQGVAGCAKAGCQLCRARPFSEVGSVVVLRSELSCELTSANFLSTKILRYISTFFKSDPARCT